MALEFQLGAGIVASTTTLSGPNLIQLAVVAVIRTCLSLISFGFGLDKIVAATKKSG